MKRLSLFAVAFVVLAACGGTAEEGSAESPVQEYLEQVEQGITYNDTNCVCSSFLYLRSSPGGAVICTLRQHEEVYVYWPPSGDYANASGFSTVECMWQRGWALKDQLSKSCC
ncbi:hypothetical protein ACLESO_38860 [Pyxidicoccus sp. 3LG]